MHRYRTNSTDTQLQLLLTLRVIFKEGDVCTEYNMTL